MRRLLAPWSTLLWNQLVPVVRLELLARLIAAAILILMTWGPYGAFSAEAVKVLGVREDNAWLDHAWDMSQHVRWTTAAAAAICVVFGVGIGAASVARTSIFAVAWMGFAFLSGMATQLTPLVWSYNTHLVIFAGLITGVAWLPALRSSKHARKEGASFVLAFGQIYVGVFYMQSALSKLIHAGPQWFATGRTAWVYANESGTVAGKSLAAYPEIFPALATLVGLAEVLFLLLFVYWPRSRRVLPLGMLAMHLSFWAVLDISFWHLWILFPALFFYPYRHETGNTGQRRQYLLAEPG
jgi:hypothetical protein